MKTCPYAKVIFLDFDGVLNDEKTTDRITHPRFPGYRIRGFDRDKVERVNRLAAETGAAIVISSTWREFYPLIDLQDLLRGYGMEAPFMDKTPTCAEMPAEQLGKILVRPGLGERGAEIQAWLDKNGTPECFVVIDDAKTQFIYSEHQVLTTDDAGFDDECFAYAKEILEDVAR